MAVSSDRGRRLGSSQLKVLPHHAALLSASRIAPQVAAARGYRSVTQISELISLGFSERQARVPALLIPIWGVAGQVVTYQIRPDDPRLDERGRPIKYETPHGSRMAMDAHPSERGQLGNPRVPLWITEGIRKGDAAVSAGLCCIALLGVWNWRGTNEHGGKVVLPDFESIALNGRAVYVAFDSDVTTKPSVRAALERLVSFLVSRGARVQIVHLPEGGDGAKVGLDDYLAAGHTTDELVGLATPELRPADAQPEFQPRTKSVGTLLEWTAAELLEGPVPAEPPSIPFLGTSGYFILGWSHLISGYPRVGKTDLLGRCTVDWLALGYEVLYITEEPRSIWQARLHSLLDHRPDVSRDTLKIVLGLGADPGALLTRATAGHEAIVIVDAARNLLGIADENDNSAVARALNPWVAGARSADKTLIVAHHDRKGGGANGEGIAGGHAFLGIFDIALEVLRDPQAQKSNRRLIRAYARLISPPELMYERADDGSLVVLGDPGAVRLDEVQARLGEILSTEGQTTKECHFALGDPRPSLEQVRLALNALAKSGRIERDPPLAAGDARGRTIRWALSSPAQETSNAPAPKVGTELGGAGGPLIDLPIEVDYPRAAWDPTAGDDGSTVEIEPVTPATT